LSSSDSLGSFDSLDSVVFLKSFKSSTA
jgi:hypothetical protein